MCVGLGKRLLLLRGKSPLRFALDTHITFMPESHRITLVCHLLKCSLENFSGLRASTNPAMKLNFL
jgi:hypothetical protein